MTLTFADALKALENQPDCLTAMSILRHMAMKDEQKTKRKSQKPDPIKFDWINYDVLQDGDLLIYADEITISKAVAVKKWIDRVIQWKEQK